MQSGGASPTDGCGSLTLCRIVPFFEDSDGCSQAVSCGKPERHRVSELDGGHRHRDRFPMTARAMAAFPQVAEYGSAAAGSGIAMTQTGHGVPSESRSRNDPMNQFRRILASVALLATVGCHCTPGYEAYNDAVDHVSDTTACFDGVYCPKLDVTRWGRWDGPACCRNKCCH